MGKNKFVGNYENFEETTCALPRYFFNVNLTVRSILTYHLLFLNCGVLLTVPVEPCNSFVFGDIERESKGNSFRYFQGVVDIFVV